MFSQDNSYVYEVMALSTSDHFPSSMYLYDKSYVMLEMVALLTIDLLHFLHLWDTFSQDLSHVSEFMAPSTSDQFPFSCVPNPFLFEI